MPRQYPGEFWKTGSATCFIAPSLFEVLYSAALGDAVDYIEAHARTGEVYVLGAMLDAVTEDSNASADRQTIQRAATLLKDALKVRPLPEIVSISEKIRRFEKAYP